MWSDAVPVRFFSFVYKVPCVGTIRRGGIAALILSTGSSGKALHSLLA